MAAFFRIFCVSFDYLSKTPFAARKSAFLCAFLCAVIFCLSFESLPECSGRVFFLYVRQEEDVARHELDAFFQVVQAEQFQVENGQTFVLGAELMGDVP